MRRPLIEALLCGLVLVLPAGCPVSPDLTDFGTPNLTGDGGGIVDNADAEREEPGGDVLSEQFPTCDTTPQEGQWRQEIFELVNQVRVAEGLDPVTQNDTLELQATQYACELIHYEFFDHVNPVTQSTLADRAEDFGYEYLVIGENLAAGQRSPVEVFNDWMDSPGHRRNIMDPRFTELGVGIRTGGPYGVYWVQEFGRPVPESLPAGTPVTLPAGR